MKKIVILICIVGVTGILSLGCRSTSLSGSGAQQTPVPAQRVVVDGMRTSYADLVQKTSPAVVRITALVTNAPSPEAGGMDDGGSGNPFEDLFPQMPQQSPREQVPQTGFGSGVIVSQDGTILTNNHVVENAQKITVELENDQSFVAKVIGTDPPSDLAVIKIEGEKFPFMNLGDSDKVLVGDIVLAIGNPLGIGQSVTSGIISAKGRRTGLGDGSFEDFLQTDAAINRGNSGGALINLNGELIGINSQILSPTGGSIGIGFSIPSNMAKSVMEQLLKTGKVKRGMLGVSIQSMNEAVAEQFGLQNTNGALVSGVQSGSAAEKAGIKRGDVITAINGEPIEDGNALRNKIASTPPGTTITLTILRDGKTFDVKATLGEFDAKTAGVQSPQGGGSAPEGENGKLGLNLQPLTPDTASQLGLPEDQKGLVVTAVDPSGAAAQEGMMRGDVILEINRQPVGSLEDARAAIEKSNGKAVLLLVSRKGRTVYLSLTPEA